MTKRVNGLIVSLDRDIREDDVEYIINAIQMVKGVQAVAANVVEGSDYLNRTRIKHKLENNLIKAVRDAFEEVNID